MLFNSYEYILAFVPLVAALYFYLNSRRLTLAGLSLLILASLFFYAWWNPAYLPLLLFSIGFNYLVGRALASPGKAHRLLLVLGVATNLAVLATFKYADFFVENVNRATGAAIPVLDMALPLAISFFTFQQIAYLVDSYRGLTREYDFLRYALFVSFFPQLIAGPIVHHKEMMPQFSAARAKLVDYRHVAAGIFIFTLGLFKKVVIADYFATVATPGFDNGMPLSLFEAWATSLAYTFQLYFDFSGYTDMAIGSALIFNIRLPINFNSPYKATNIQDFWRRWHITLSRFLRDYVYVPLGGNRRGPSRTYVNLMATFLLGGLWHGAGWTFVFWGFLHGAAAAIHRGWSGLGGRMPRWLAWFVTFNFLNLSWVFFRAKEWDDAVRVLTGMVGGHGVHLSDKLLRFDLFAGLAAEHPQLFTPMAFGRTPYITVLVALAFVLLARNSQQYLARFRTDTRTLLASIAVFTVTLLNMNRVSEFLYFNF